MHSHALIIPLGIFLVDLYKKKRLNLFGKIWCCSVVHTIIISTITWTVFSFLLICSVNGSMLNEACCLLIVLPLSHTYLDWIIWSKKYIFYLQFLHCVVTSVSQL